MDTKISIIIPAYNIEACLGTTLDSVLAQTHRNLEVIVVNDGSTDGTGRILDTYAAKDCRVKAIHKENGGVTSARLRGISETTGEFIGFVDGDDVIEADMYARLLENARTHCAQISHCGYRMVFPNGRVDYYYNTGKTVVQKGEQGCTDLLEGSFIEPGLVNKLCRRELFAGLADWIDKSVRMNEDLLMNFYLFRQAETAVFEDFCPYHYLLRQGSACISRLSDYKLADPIRVRQLLMEETKDHPRWNAIVHGHLVYFLIRNATLPDGGQRSLVAPHRKAARKELRRKLFEILSSGSFSLKTKLMVLWTAIWPASYCWAHQFYAKLSGVDKKFSLA